MISHRPNHWKDFAMSVPVYPDVNTGSASGEGANRSVHRFGEDVNTGDQLPSPYLLGIAAAGSFVACLLIRLVFG
jgi:hypothetical protein